MSGVDLNPNQQELRNKIESYLKVLKDDIPKNELTHEETKEIFDNMAKLAHELHMQLEPKPKHHKYMIENRGLLPDHPDFYRHIHPTEDLIDYLDNTHANDDPEDVTIGNTFNLKIFSKRWGHDDLYKLVRTPEGWNFSFLSYDGPCDKQGIPFLYKALKHDSISYPIDLPGFLEWLWDQAEEQGLSKDEVQSAMDDISEWIRVCEVNTPRGIFRGYK
ncbi:hypothetical protein [Bacillus sp. NEB1478]|uniref:hypothetical protein n=1 Tax=Bacillus sp. NEB1478 TaxID=3073816 RepID=UPI00287311C4|nr:hypothetical protein [Bacillus sp. NEB1478]WNB93421.1 hypothetical protein RGB74_07055 [Bacillus sp. NEB1478]